MRRRKNKKISNYLVPAIACALVGFATSSVSSYAETPGNIDYNMLEQNYVLAEYDFLKKEKKYLKEKKKRDVAYCLLAEYKLDNGIDTDKSYEEIRTECSEVKKNYAQ